MMVEPRETRQDRLTARTQYAALPFRVGDQIEVLLITSRETQRWVIPKGWPMKRRSPPRAAEREALEEAGIRGRIGKQSLGSYHYVKRGGAGETWLCDVDVYPLQVRKEKPGWREQKQRIRRWFSLEAAAKVVEEPELKAIILGFRPDVAGRLRRGSSRSETSSA